MKKKLVIALFVFFSWTSMAQIQSEYSINFSGTWTELESDGSVFYIMDVVGEQCKLYTADYILWKTININVPNKRWLADIQFVSQHLFDTDDEVEILIVYYEYVQTSSSYYYNYTTQVINEDGTVLLNVPLGSYSLIYNTNDTGTKLMVYETDYSSYPYPVTTHVYGLPGTWLGTGSEDLLNAESGIMKAWPNPSNGAFSLNYSIPGQPRESWFLMYDLEGNEIVREPLRPEGDNLEFNRPDLAAGQYVMRIVTPNYQSKGQSITISK